MRRRERDFLLHRSVHSREIFFVFRQVSAVLFGVFVHRFFLTQRREDAKAQRVLLFFFASSHLCVFALKILVGRQNASAAFAEADSAETFAFAEAFHNDFVAVF